MADDLSRLRKDEGKLLFNSTEPTLALTTRFAGVMGFGSLALPSQSPELSVPDFVFYAATLNR